MSVRQALFLTVVALGHLTGRSVTLSRIMEEHGDELGKTIGKSYFQFLEPTRKNPDALGWVIQEHDPDDRRVRYLKLSEQGQAVVGDLVLAMRKALP